MFFKKFVLVGMVLLLALCAFSAPEKYWSEVADTAKEGTDYTKIDEVIHIKTPLGLAWFASQINGKFEGAYLDAFLENDLNMSGYFWRPIGSSGVEITSENLNAEIQPYSGIFDGNGKTIKGLTYSPKDFLFGLFSCVMSDVKSMLDEESLKNLETLEISMPDKNGVVKNLTISIDKDISIQDKAFYGSVSITNVGTIENCHVINGTKNKYAEIKIIKNILSNSTESSISGGSGIVLFNSGTIKNCSVDGISISGFYGASGIAGLIDGLLSGNKNITAINCKISNSKISAVEPFDICGSNSIACRLVRCSSENVNIVYEQFGDQISFANRTVDATVDEYTAENSSSNYSAVLIEKANNSNIKE